jgi:ATP-dependent DNA helicase DinG
MVLARAALDALTAVTTALPGGGETREGQRTMAAAVADAIESGRHLLVQAGTGTGKSLAYLVPAVMSGRRVVVATATKALQDQLATKDLPFLTEHLSGLRGAPLRWAVLKGRSNYVCRQRLVELSGHGAKGKGKGKGTGTGDQLGLGLDGLADAAKPEELERIKVWAAQSDTGDRAELDFEPAARTWAAVSVGVRECPGATRCPSGESCFAERARRHAAEADIIVVNQHLFALDLVLDGVILPEHDIVVIDEAHQTEDTVAAAAGSELTAGRFDALARVSGAILEDDGLLGGVEEAGRRVADEAAAHLGTRLVGGMPDALADAVNLARDRTERVMHALGKVPDDGPGDVGARKLRAVQAATALVADIDTLLFPKETDVAWVEGRPEFPVIRVAPVDVAPTLSAALWSKKVAVLTSATLPANLAGRLGLDATFTFDELDVGSPFDYEHQALLYCAVDLPDPRGAGYREALHAELEELIVAAGGRTLALFTSWKAMHEAVEHLRPRLPWPVLAQGDLPKTALVDTFTADPQTSLFATMSFWQGVDLPGDTLTLVTIDRLPFPRPDDPLLEARRELAGPSAFRDIDLPRAATLLAQGAGRLIRTAHDRGVVAVLDPRLAKNRSYRWDIIRSLPPMRRTRHRAEAIEFLKHLRDQ